jgi:hypothetical protein
MSKKNKDAAMMSDAESVTDDENEGSTNLATRDENIESALTMASDERTLAIAAMSDKEQMEELVKLLDCHPEEIEAIATGRLPFWPAIPGKMVVGVLVGQREVPTRFGTAKLYTLNLKRPSIAATLDGEVFELPAGENISILERIVLKELAMREGQEIGILCAGKKKTRSGKFEYWDYKIAGVRRTAEQVQASAQMAMARLQVRALPVSTTQKG